MGDERLPKIVLFGELKNKRPAHGPKKRWRDLVSADLQQLGMVTGWYQVCQDRGEWYKRCQEGVDLAERTPVLPVSPLGRELLCANVGKLFGG